MNRDIDDNDLRALRGEGKEPSTFDERKRAERNARTRYDARRDRPVMPLLQINFSLSPEDKARMVRLCKSRDIKIVDFLRQAVRDAIEKLEAE